MRAVVLGALVLVLVTLAGSATRAKSQNPCRALKADVYDEAMRAELLAWGDGATPEAQAVLEIVALRLRSIADAGCHGR